MSKRSPKFLKHSARSQKQIENSERILKNQLWTPRLSIYDQLDSDEETNEDDGPRCSTIQRIHNAYNDLFEDDTVSSVQNYNFAKILSKMQRLTTNDDSPFISKCKETNEYDNFNPPSIRDKIDLYNNSATISKTEKNKNPEHGVHYSKTPLIISPESVDVPTKFNAEKMTLRQYPHCVSFPTIFKEKKMSAEKSSESKSIPTKIKAEKIPPVKSTKSLGIPTQFKAEKMPLVKFQEMVIVPKQFKTGKMPFVKFSESAAVATQIKAEKILPQKSPESTGIVSQFKAGKMPFVKFSESATVATPLKVEKISTKIAVMDRESQTCISICSVPAPKKPIKLFSFI